jgi:hypothetical protein
LITVNIVRPVTPAAMAAEIWLLPTATPVARPFEPAAFEMVAVASVAETQVALAVTS